MEKGLLSREDFMAGIAAMTERMVRRPKEYDRDTIPATTPRSNPPCPNCGGVVKKTTAAFACVGKPGAEPAASALANRPQAARSRQPGQRPAARRKIGPLGNFRSRRAGRSHPRSS